MGTINYDLDQIRRHLIFEDGKLIKAQYFAKDETEKGMVFLGRIEDFHNPLKGYFVDLSTGRKGLYQTKEKLDIGRHYLFEVKKVQSGKQPLLSRKIGLVGKYVIYRPFQETTVSKSLSQSLKKHFLQLGHDHVYYRSECALVSSYHVEEEIEELKNAWTDMLRIQQTQRKAALLFEPKVNETNWDDASIIEFEEKILRLRHPFVLVDDMRFDIEMTRVGLVIDVNTQAYKGTHDEANRKAISFVSDLLITMNVGGIVLVDLVGNGVPETDLELLKEDKRNRIVNISPLGILEISRKRDGLNMYDISFLETLARFIHLKIEKAKRNGQNPTGISVSKRYAGIEEYLDLPVTFSEVFGYFSLH